MTWAWRLPVLSRVGAEATWSGGGARGRGLFKYPQITGDLKWWRGRSRQPLGPGGEAPRPNLRAPGGVVGRERERVWRRRFRRTVPGTVSATRAGKARSRGVQTAETTFSPYAFRGRPCRTLSCCRRRSWRRRRPWPPRRQGGLRCLGEASWRLIPPKRHPGSGRRP